MVGQQAPALGTAWGPSRRQEQDGDPATAVGISSLRVVRSMWPESDAEYDWVDANVVRVHSWHWLGVIGSTSGVSGERLSVFAAFALCLNLIDPFQISSTLSARPSPWHRIDHRWRPCYIFHSRNSYWRYHWHVQHCHEGRYFICKMPLRAQPTSWFHLAQSGYTCGKTNYRDLGSDLTISGCYTASRNDGNCNGQGFHYYPIRLGKFGQCFCGTATDVRDDGTCISKSVESVQNNADYNHIYMYKFFEYYLAVAPERSSGMLVRCILKPGRIGLGLSEIGSSWARGESESGVEGPDFRRGHGFEFYANSKHEDSKCWLFSGHKREGHIIPVRAYTGRRYKDAVCYIKAPYLEDGCANDYGIPGYKFSHLGYWYMHIRTSAGDASLSSCATQCDRARYACIGFHLFEDGNARHCYLYKQERAFHWSVSDGRAKAFVKCKQPTYHANDQSVGWKHFSDHCEEKGQRLCSYQDPAVNSRLAFAARLFFHTFVLRRCVQPDEAASLSEEDRRKLMLGVPSWTTKLQTTFDVGTLALSVRSSQSLARLRGRETDGLWRTHGLT
eukprot:s4571_g9.t1